MLRPVRDAMGAAADVEAVFSPATIAWFAGRGIAIGDFTLQALFTATFLGMLVLQPVYGWLVSRFPRRVFLPAVYLALHRLPGRLLPRLPSRRRPGAARSSSSGSAVFNLFAVSVFWSFMADIFSNAESRRRVRLHRRRRHARRTAGPWLTGRWSSALGVANMMLVSVACLAMCLVCIVRLGGWARQSELRARPPHDEAMGGSVLEGLRLVARDPLLRWMAVLMFFGVGVGTLLYNQQREIAKLLIADDTFRTQFYANLDLWINLLTLVHPGVR